MKLPLHYGSECPAFQKRNPFNPFPFPLFFLPTFVPPTPLRKSGIRCSGRPVRLRRWGQIVFSCMKWLLPILSSQAIT